MKLVSLYIENFGGLSQYSLTFGDGVTVVQEPNGFGKTTLAEFIRAMFYGFPRKTKTLEKSRRQKYTPWNGGKCGGNLVFELEGQRYRIERTFGATPKSDTFKLIDLSTGKKSGRFSEEIGQELFQLDGDSFERSTYMPQLRDSGSFTTNTIQAKLSDLVEDTGDINNFDKAVDTLKSKRSTFIPYRGSGGSVAEARNQISRVQSRLDLAETKREDLQRSQERIAQLEVELKKKSAAVAAVRADITKTSEAAASAALRREYEQLLARKEADRKEAERLKQKYSRGVPKPEELDRIEKTADRAAVLAQQKVTTQADLDAQQYLEENRRRFEDHVPDTEELETRRQQCTVYEALLTKARNTGLSERENMQYEELCSLYEAGKLDGETLEQLTGQNRELVKLRHNLESTVMTPEDTRLLEELECFFAAGIPEQEQIDSCRQKLISCRQPEIMQPIPRKQKSVLPLILALVLGILGITLGVVLLTKGTALLGGIALGLGVLALVGAIFLGVRMMISRELSGGAGRENPEIQARIGQTEREIRNFTGRYVTSEDPAEALHEIEEKRNAYLTLARRRDAVREKRSDLEARANQLEQQLRKALDTAQPEFDNAIMERRLAREQFRNLRARKAAAEEQAGTLLARADAIRNEVTAFLRMYYENVAPERFGALLALLQQEGDTYLRSKAQVLSWEERRAQHDRETAECGEELERFFACYDLRREEDIRRQLQQIRQDDAQMVDITCREAAREPRLRELQTECGEALTAPQPEELPDLEVLKEQESRLNGDITDLTRQLLEQRQSRKELRVQVDGIPQLQDELAVWQEKKNADQKKAQILDDTLDFLQKARDSLSSSYLGPIRTSFCGYMSRLAGETGEKILISPDLEVQLERQGQARELAYFSAGQTDLTMLCMRLALVDALFADVKPFVILDDPFVNLDDEHTAEALTLLRELGKDRQILYLTCNSSRAV